MVETSLRFRRDEEVLAGYFGHAPLAHALFRGAEALALCGQPLRGPLLDLGCGAGQFAALAVAGDIDVGADACARQLGRAAATGRFRRLVHGDARRLALPDQAFATVLSVSALEHMPEPSAVVAEVSRLLRPGGRFVGTAVLADLRQHLAYPRMLRRVGLGAAARWYERTHERVFQHRTLLAQPHWEALFATHGLRLVLSRRILSPRLTYLWDLLLPAALPGWLLGVRRSWRPRWLARRLARLLARRGRADAPDGSVWFFVAEKLAAGPAGADPGDALTAAAVAAVAASPQAW